MKKILTIAILIILLTTTVLSVGYDINKDKDVNKFEADDYLDLGKAAVGETTRSAAKNSDWIVGAFVIGGLAAIGVIILVYIIRRRK